MNASAEQAKVLRAMAADGERIVRLPGGFWVTPSVTLDTIRSAPYAEPKPYTSIQTVRAMERKGLVERTHEYPEEWRDTRRLTAAGRAA